MGKARVDPMLLPQRPDPGRNRSRIATHDLAAAMGEDGLAHPFPLAPIKLGGDRRMPDQGVVPVAYHRALDRGAVAHIKVHAPQGRVPLANGNEVGDIEEGRAISRHPVADGGRSDGMVHGEGLDFHPADLEWLARLDDAALADRIAGKPRPRLRSGVDGAWRPMSQPEGMVGMRMGDDDGGGRDGRKRREPIGAAIDHDASAPLPHEKGAVTAMAARSELDLATGSKKGQLDGVSTSYEGCIGKEADNRRRRAVSLMRIKPEGFG